MSVAVRIPEGCTHRSHFTTVFIIRDGSDHSLFRERAVLIVDEQVAGTGVVSDVQIGPPILVYIRPLWHEAIPTREITHSGAGCHVFKRSVASVSE